MPLRIQNGNWHYRFQLAGVLICETTGLAATKRNEDRARRMEAEHREAMREGRLAIRRLIPMPFNRAVEEFLAHKKVEHAQTPSTWLRIRTTMTSAREFFGDRIVSLIGEGDIERYKVWRLGELGVKNITCRHDLDSLSLFFKHAVQMDWTRGNPTANVAKPSAKDSTRIHVVSDLEERLYFQHAKGMTRDVARLMLLQGTRPDELYSLQKSEIDLDRRTIKISKSKTRSGRRILDLTTESVQILAARMQASAAGPWLFPSPRDSSRHILKLNKSHDEVLAAAKVSFVLYDFRHTFATRLAQAGCDLATLAAILGHNSLSMVMVYVHPTAEHKKKAMQNYDAVLQAANPTVVQ